MTMFYVIEGIDGIGKSTQAQLLADYLERERGRSVLRLREPGGTPLAEKVRELLLDPDGGDLSAVVEAFLFMAARAHLCQTRIRPALDRAAASGKPALVNVVIRQDREFKGGTYV